MNMDIETPQNAKIVNEFFAWALARTGNDSIHLLEVGPLLHEWTTQNGEHATKEEIEKVLDQLLIDRGEHPTRVRNPLYGEERELAKALLSHFMKTP